MKKLMKKTIQKNLLPALVVLSMCPLASAHAAQLPRRMAADPHVKRTLYDPNNVVVLTGQYGYQTQITFAPGETVQTVSLGDSQAWQAVPVKNHLFIKPVADSKTNMTVLTDQRSYTFQLQASSKQVRPTYKLQFTYPADGQLASDTTHATVSVDPDKLNWKYSFTGARSLAPVAAFDDGQFTYFRFHRDGLHPVPAIFKVGSHRQETLVNLHQQGQYVVIHSVARQFTLRDGDTVTSVYNDLAIGDWQSIR